MQKSIQKNLKKIQGFVKKSPMTKVVLSIAGVIALYEVLRLGIVFFGGAVWGVLFPKDSDLDIPAQAVEAQLVRKGAIVRRITVPGRFVAKQKVDLKPEVQGKLKAVRFKGGQYVTKGDILYEIDDRVFRAKVKEAQARHQLAKQEFERASKLEERSAGPLKQKEKAQSNLLEAEAAVEIAQHKLDNTTIRAPFSGWVGINDVTPGSFVDERTELVTIVDANPIRLDFRVPAQYLKKISVGQTVQVTPEGFSGKALEGRIINVDAKIDPSVHSVAVRAELSNPRGLLKPGLFSRLEVVVGSKDDALLVPRSSVKSRGDEEYVFKVLKVPNKKGGMTSVAFKQPIVTGLSSGEELEIVRGLTEGEPIVSVGQNKLRHGFPLEIQNKEDLQAATEEEEVEADTEEVAGVEEEDSEAEALEEELDEVLEGDFEDEGAGEDAIAELEEELEEPVEMEAEEAAVEEEPTEAEAVVEEEKATA